MTMIGKITQLQAIKRHCLDCMFGDKKEVAACEEMDCNLHPFRMGKNPFHPKRDLTDEEKKEMVERLRRGRNGTADL